MKFIVTENYEAMSRKAAAILAAKVVEKPNCVLGLATGSTPVGTYQNLIRWYESGDLDFSQVKSVNLDEYVGLAPTHDQSYRYFMQTNLFDHINIDPANTNVPNGMAEDPEAACAQYDEIIRSMGGVDIQVLGMGHNGHIAFNEPNTEFVYPTNVIELTESTIEANKRFFNSADEVPRKAICMGVGSIMAAKRVILLATGKGKAEAIARAVQGKIEPDMPASILRVHPNCQFLLDEEAASLLK